MGKHAGNLTQHKRRREDFVRIVTAIGATLDLTPSLRSSFAATFSREVRGETRSVSVHMPDAAVITHVETRAMGHVVRSATMPRAIPESIQIAVEHLLGDR